MYTQHSNISTCLTKDKTKKMNQRTSIPNKQHLIYNYLEHLLGGRLTIIAKKSSQQSNVDERSLKGGENHTFSGQRTGRKWAADNDPTLEPNDGMRLLLPHKKIRIPTSSQEKIEIFSFWEVRSRRKTYSPQRSLLFVREMRKNIS